MKLWGLAHDQQNKIHDNANQLTKLQAFSIPVVSYIIWFP